MDKETKILAYQAIDENVKDSTARQVIRYVMKCAISGLDTIKSSNQYIARKYGWTEGTAKVAVAKAKKSQFITITGRGKTRSLELNVQFLKGKMGEIQAKRPLDRRAYVLKELSSVVGKNEHLPNKNLTKIYRKSNENLTKIYLNSKKASGDQQGLNINSKGKYNSNSDFVANYYILDRPSGRRETIDHLETKRLCLSKIRKFQRRTGRNPAAAPAIYESLLEIIGDMESNGIPTHIRVLNFLTFFVDDSNPNFSDDANFVLDKVRSHPNSGENIDFFLSDYFYAIVAVIGNMR